MKRKKVITSIIAGLMLLSNMTFASANNTPNTKVFLKDPDVQQELRTMHLQALNMYLEGDYEGSETVCLDNSLAQQIMQDERLYATYIRQLDIYDEDKKPISTHTLENGEVVYVYPDGSFITEKISVEQIGTPKLTRDPIDIVYTGREDHIFKEQAFLLVQESHLITDYEYGNYWVRVIDVTASARTGPGVSLLSKSSSTVISSGSKVQTKADFQFKDIMGTFGRVMKTTITGKAHFVTVSRENIMV